MTVSKRDPDRESRSTTLIWKAAQLIPATASLAVASFVAWDSWIKPFEPVGSIGAVILQGAKGTSQLRLIVPIRIVNNGAQAGTIDDLAVRCNFQSQVTREVNRCLFLPTGFYISDYLSKKIAQKPEIEFYKALFAPILLLPRQGFAETVHFVIDSDHPFNMPPLPCHYQGEVLMRTRKEPWLSIDSFDGEFNASTLSSLMNGVDIQAQSSLYLERRKELSH